MGTREIALEVNGAENGVVLEGRRGGGRARSKADLSAKAHLFYGLLFMV